MEKEEIIKKIEAALNDLDECNYGRAKLILLELAAELTSA